jgi:hypothetical protein
MAAFMDFMLEEEPAKHSFFSELDDIVLSLEELCLKELDFPRWAVMPFCVSQSIEWDGDHKSHVLACMLRTNTRHGLDVV